MKQYTYFSKEGNRYTLKPQTGLSIFIAVVFVALGIATIIYSSIQNFGYVLIAVAGLAIYSQSKRKFIVDADKKMFVIKNNGFQSEAEYPFDTFDGITMHKVRYFGLLTINVSAVAYFIVNGKENRGSLNQAFTSAPIQGLINELDEILEKCEISSDNQRNSSMPSF